VELARLPLSPAARAVLQRAPDLIESIVSGGDDYVVLAAVPPSRAPEFEASAAARGLPVSEIGVLTSEAGLTFVTPAGEAYTPRHPGWDHF